MFRAIGQKASHLFSSANAKKPAAEPASSSEPAKDCKCSEELAKLEAVLRQERTLWEQERNEDKARIASLTSELAEAKQDHGTEEPSLLQQLYRLLNQAETKCEEKQEARAPNLQGLEEKKGQPPPREGRSRELKACDLRELIEAKQREYFQGSREWLFDAVREWLNDEEKNNNNKKRVFWLCGGAGTGKSVVSAQLLRTAGVQEHVKAWHFCRHDNAAGSDVRVILESWAAMLSALLPSFHVEDVSKALASTNVDEMFDLLIAEPFNKVLQQRRGASSSSALPMPLCVLVLDAVDELPRDCLKDVLQLIADKFDKLPSFVKLFVASRDESEVSSRLSRFDPVKLLVEEVRNQADLRMYLAHVARRHVTMELSTEDLETQLEREFNLQPFRLRGELRGLDQLLRRSKDTYAAAIAKFEATDHHYRELCGISDFLSTAVRQCTGDLEELYADAREAHHKLRGLFAKEWREWKTVGQGTTKTVLSVPVEGTALWVDKIVDPGLKDRASSLRKVARDYEGDCGRLKDLVRFTASFTGCGRMKQFVEQLLHSQALGVEVLGVKNKYSSPTPLGYRDLNVTLQVRLASGRAHVCELQVNLEDMLVAKELAHEFYEEVRVEIPDLCKRAGVADVAKFESNLTKMLHSSVLETVVRELQDKAGGLFLCASLLARQLEGSVGKKKKVDFKQLRGLPVGLSEVYQTNFERMVQSRQDWHNLYSPLIALIVAAREPLPVSLAREVMGAGWSDATMQRVLFPVREGRFRVMHKSITDWLQDSERKSVFEINKESILHAHRSLGTSLQHNSLLLPRSAASCVPSSAMADAFCVGHVVYHLCEAEMWEELFKVVTDVKWLLARAEMDALGAVLDLEHAARRCVKHRATIKLMGQALRMDLGELQFDYRSVPTRLVARLLGHSESNKEVEELLTNLRKWEGPPQGWWCPSQPTYLPAGGPLQTTFPAQVNSVQWMPGDENLLAIACGDELHIWEVSSRKCIRTFKGHSRTVYAVSWSNDGSRICSGSDDNTVRVWEVSSGKCIQTLQGHHSRVTAVSWSSDGSRICSGSWDYTVRVWEVSTGECIQTLEGHSSRVSAVSWSDGSRICSGSNDNTVRVWEVASGRCIQTLEGHPSYVTAVSWSSDGSQICSGSIDTTVRVWEVSSGMCIQTLEGHSSPVNAVTWSSDGSRICSGSFDTTVRVWEVASGECIQTLKGHSSLVNAVSWSSDGSRICSGSGDKTVRVWEVLSGKTLKGHSSDVTAVSWSNDGSRVYSGSDDNTVRVWEVSSGACTHTLKGHGSRVTAMSWSGDESRICSGSWDTTVRVWDVSSGECLQTLKGHSSGVNAVSWSNDGSRICSGSSDITVRVWEVSSGECIQTLKGHSSDVNAVSWSSDGTRICSGSDDNTVRVWEVASGECIQTLEGHAKGVKAVSWSNDGSRICSGSDDRTVRVWEVASGKCIQILEGHSDSVTAVSWSNDGSRICSNDKIVRVWEVSSAICLMLVDNDVSLPIGVHVRSHARLSLCPALPTDFACEIEGSSVHCLRRLGGTPHGEVKSFFALCPQTQQTPKEEVHLHAHSERE